MAPNGKKTNRKTSPPKATKKLKSFTNPTSSTSAPILNTINPQLFLGKDPIPQKWYELKDRKIVWEKIFDIEEIWHKLPYFVPDPYKKIFELNNFQTLAHPKNRAYESLVKLFYSGLSSDNEFLKVSIGSFEFLFNADDINSVLNLKLPNNAYSWSDKDKDSPTKLQQHKRLFLNFEPKIQKAPYTHKHYLILHIYMYLYEFIRFNVYPSLGNSTEMSIDSVELLYLLLTPRIFRVKTKTPRIVNIGEVVIKKMKTILKSKNNALSFPFLIHLLLEKKNFPFPPKISEKAVTPELYTSVEYNLMINMGRFRRGSFFYERNKWVPWKQIEGRPSCSEELDFIISALKSKNLVTELPMSQMEPSCSYSYPEYKFIPPPHPDTPAWFIEFQKVDQKVRYDKEKLVHSQIQSLSKQLKSTSSFFEALKAQMMDDDRELEDSEDEDSVEGEDEFID